MLRPVRIVGIGKRKFKDTKIGVSLDNPAFSSKEVGGMVTKLLSFQKLTASAVTDFRLELLYQTCERRLS